MTPEEMFGTSNGPIEGVEEDGRLVECIVRVQCMGGVRDVDGNLVEPCGQVIDAVLNLEDGEVESHVPCPHCSQRSGMNVLIPVAVLVGDDVGATLAEPDDADVPPIDDMHPFDGPVTSGGMRRIEAGGPDDPERDE